MEINSIQSFISYYMNNREITLKVIKAIPKENINWAYKPGKFSFGDIIRHIAGIERWVFAEVSLGNKPAYKGCGEDIAKGFEKTIAYFNEMQEQSLNIFNNLNDEDLNKIVKTLDGREIELKNFLRALFVHEIHHRAALCIYLNLLDIESPPIIGLKEEEVKRICS